MVDAFNFNNYSNRYKWKTKKNYKKVNYLLNSKTSQMKKKTNEWKN
jgi:hypothetical protein